MPSWFEEKGLVAIFDPDPAERAELERTCAKLPLHSIRNDLGWLVLSSNPLSQQATPHAPLEVDLWRTPTEHGFDASLLSLAKGEATITRAVSGFPAIHFSRAPNGRLVISTRLGWLAIFACKTVKLDGLITLLQGIGWPAHPDNRAVVQGAFTLAPGETTQLASDRTTHSVAQTWSVPAKPVPVAPQRILAALRRYLNTHLADSGNLLLYSGGLDSSAIAAVSSRLLGKSLNLTTRSIPFHLEAAGREFFYVSGGGRGTRPHTVSGENSVQEADVLRAAPDFSHVGGHLGLVHHTRNSFGSEQRTLVIGWGADELFGVLRFADWVTATRPHQLWRALHVPERQRLARWWLLRRLSRRHGLHLPPSLRPFTAPDLQREYRDFRDAESPERGSEPWAARLTHVRRFGDWMGPIWESTAAEGLDLVAPFTALDMVRIGYELHPHELFGRGQGKLPLRDAVQHILPRELVHRVDDGDWRVPILSERPLPELGALAPLLDIEWIQRQHLVDVGTALELRLLKKAADAPARVEHERKNSQIPTPGT